MARTVDTSSTFENWRQNYNDLATDVGALGNLTTGNKTSIVSAVNFIMDQYFFFQDFDFDGQDGATSNTVFSGNDNAGNSLAYSAGKVLVYKNGLLLRSGTDYTATNGTSITLASSASNSDVIRISAFTGSYENVSSNEGTSGTGQFILSGGVLHNKNTGGVVLNGDSSITTTVDTANTIQLAGDTFAVGDLSIKSLSGTRNELRLLDSDNSHYVAIKSPATVSSNVTFTMPSADGSSGQFLKTDGSGNFSFDTVSSTAPDITISANNSTDETVFPVFVDGATGTQGLESDSGFTYNPSSGVLTATQFTGALSGNATTATTLASNRNFSITGDVTASAVAFNGSGNVALATSLAADSVNSAEIVDGAIDTVHIADGNVTLAKMAANSIDSDQYVDGSIDTIHISDNAINAAKLNISGNGSSGQAILSDGDGSFSYGSSGKTTEEIQDIVGAMFTSNTETRISATYEDGDGTIDLVVDDMTANDNTQLSDAQVRSKLSAGTGISYNNSTGVITNSSTNTDTLPAAGTGISVSGATVTNSGVTSIVAGSNISISGGTGAVTITATDTNTNTVTTNIAGTGVSVSSGTGNSTISIGQAVATSSDVQFDSFGVGTAASGTSGEIRATNDITAFYSSDISLKENINPISNALDKLSQIGGYTFDWTDKFIKERGGEDNYFMRKKDTGIIAQEIEEILPEVVATRPNGTKAVKYDRLTPLLIQAIKELKTELDELKSSRI